MTKRSAEQEKYRNEAKRLRILKKDLGGWIGDARALEVKTYLKKYKYARDAYIYLEVIICLWIEV